MSKRFSRSDLHRLVPRTLSLLRTAANDLPQPGAVGTQVLRALLVLAAVPAGCVAQPAPVMVRIAHRAKPAAVAVIGAHDAVPNRFSSHGGWA